MKQGEIWYADLNPIQGSEQAGRRPVAIISGNLMNDHSPLVIVTPLTTKIKNFKGNPLLAPNTLNGLKSESEGLVFHIRSLSKERLVKKVGVMEKVHLETVKKTLNDLLRY